MGRIVFSSKVKDVHVYRGRTLIDGYLRNITKGLFRYGCNKIALQDGDYKAIRTLTDVDYIQEMCQKKDRRVQEAISTLLSVGESTIAGKDNGFVIMVNTALALGSDLLCFLAYISAGCEINIYIQEKDKEYFADLLSEGITQNIIPKTYGKQYYPSGWEDVVTMFRNAPGPIVVSYSVCSIFPEGWGEDCLGWDIMGPEDKWDVAIEKILSDKDRFISRGLREKIGNGTTIMDINSTIQEVLDRG